MPSRDDIANGSEIASCFDPHHAIRIVHEDTTNDVVICYKCRGYERTENGKLKTTSYPMDVRSRDLLNHVLKSQELRCRLYWHVASLGASIIGP